MNFIKKNTSLYIFLKNIKYSLMNIFYSKKSNKIIQTASTTFHNRHPDLFNFLKEKYQNEEIKILSFGCSTGEECQSVSEYLPNATIIGAEINLSSLKKAKKNNQNPLIKFVYSDKKTLEENGPYDVILALSVLCKNPEAEHVKDISKLYTFNQYKETVEMLDTLLKKNGVLLIRSSNFRFKETNIYSKYKVINYDKIRNPIHFPKFSKDNLRIHDFLENEEIFQKLE